MKKLIHNLRQKPPHIRRMVAFVTSIAVTGLVGIIWISNLIALGVNAPIETAESKTPSPIALMYNGMKDFFQSTGKDLASVSESFNSIQATTSNTIVTSSDGAIGVSATSNSTDDSRVNSLTTEQ